VRLALEMMFEGTQGTGDLGRVDAAGPQPGGGQVLRIGNAVTLAYQPSEPGNAGGSGRIVLEWCGGSDADMVADAVVAVVLQAAGQPPGLSAIEVQRHKALQAGDHEAAEHAELGIVTALLNAQFGPARVDTDQVNLLAALAYLVLMPALNALPNHNYKLISDRG
jgi:cleavage and polyadenylation specificity factor subunit 3